MKILMIGSGLDSAIEMPYKKYLTGMGCEVDLFPAPDISLRHISKNIFNKILFKTGIYRGYRIINREILKMAGKVKPDVIWVWKGMELFPATLNILNKKFLLAAYNPDHPFIFAGPGSGNANVRKSVGCYRLYFCYQKSLLKRIHEEFNVKTQYLPFGFDLSESDFQNASAKPEMRKVCFIGNPDRLRVQTIQFLASAGLQIDVFGHGWNKTSLRYQENVKTYDAVYGAEFWNNLRRYRIQLNIFREHNTGSHNMRTFEIPAVGGIQLTPYSEEQSLFFTADEEVFFYRNNEELLSQANRLLEFSADKAEVVRESARRRSLRSGYDYQHRAMTVFNSFSEMLSR